MGKRDAAEAKVLKVAEVVAWERDEEGGLLAGTDDAPPLMGGEALVKFLMGDPRRVHVPHNADGLVDTAAVELNGDLGVVKHAGPLDGVGLDAANKVWSGLPDLVGEVGQGLLELGAHSDLEDLGATRSLCLAGPHHLGPLLLLRVLPAHLCVEHAARKEGLGEGAAGKWITRKIRKRRRKRKKKKIRKEEVTICFPGYRARDLGGEDPCFSPRTGKSHRTRRQQNV